MTIEAQLNDRLKQAMMAKDSRSADVVRMLKTRVMERRTAKGFAGAVDDALHLDVIAAYVKQLRKSIEEYSQLGERGKETIAQFEFEIAFCEQYLPKKLDASATEPLVREAITRLGVTDPRMVGRVVGDVMKAHKDAVDAAVAKQIAERVLQGG